MKRHLSTAILLVVLFVGVALLLYPAAGEVANSFKATQAVDRYESAVEKLSDEQLNELFVQAEAYNKKLAATPEAFYDPDLVSGYSDALDVLGNGMIGYLVIPSIDVELPIYHSVDDAVLDDAVGHLPGTSLPVGGSSTHSVLSGHTGAVSAMLLTDLDRLEIGSIFSIVVLNRTLTYSVDQIEIVLPDEVESLKVVPGKDYSTVLTCTPYGINSHRLLVTGVRVGDQSAQLSDQSESGLVSIVDIVLDAGLSLLVVILLVLVVKNAIWNRRHKA